MLFCFSNALHGIIVFTMNNSLPSEEIHDSLCSQTMRPWGNPVSSPMLVFHFPKAAWASLCLAHTVIGQGDAFSFCVARRDAPPVPLSELVPAPLLLRADSGQYLIGVGREGRAAFLVTLLPESGLKCCSQAAKSRIDFYCKSRFVFGGNSSDTEWRKKGVRH